MNPIELVAALFTAIDSHQAIVDSLNPSYKSRASALKALRDAGYTSVQDGRSTRAATKHEIPFDKDLKNFFMNRFEAVHKTSQIKINEGLALQGKDPVGYQEPTKEQSNNNLAQQVRALNYYLKTGIFTTNVGRENSKNELQAALAAAQKKEEAAVKKAAEGKAALAALLVERQADRLKIELEAAEWEAEVMLLDAQVALSATQVAENPSVENKLAADKALAAKALAADKALADKALAAKALADKALADKAQAEKLAAQKAVDDKNKPTATKINFKAKISPAFINVARGEIKKLEYLPVAVRVAMARMWLAQFETTD